jgi:hypothetical protein
VTDFVEQCRREWKRLRVPDAVANEMAADLAADLTEAEAEGVSAEEVLGSGAFDPRSFADTWAAERGVIPSALQQEPRSRKPLVLASIASFSVLGVIAGALAILASRSGVAVAMVPQGRRVLPAPPAPSEPFPVHPGAVNLLGWSLLLVAILGIILSAWLWSTWNRSRRPTAPA